MSKITILAITVSVCIGGAVGYWFRGQQDRAAAMAAITAPASIITMAPPSKEPLPLVNGAVPPAKP